MIKFDRGNSFSKIFVHSHDECSELLIVLEDFLAGKLDLIHESREQVQTCITTIYRMMERFTHVDDGTELVLLFTGIQPDPVFFILYAELSVPEEPLTTELKI